MLVIGLKEKPNLFLALECRAGGEGEPVAVRYSLGWTVIGPVGGESYSSECSANFLRSVDSSNVCTSMLDLEDSVSYDNLKRGVVFPANDENAGKELLPTKVVWSQRVIPREWSSLCYQTKSHVMLRMKN